MSCSTERRLRSLHLFVRGADPRCPDPFGLVEAIGEPLDRLLIFGWTAPSADLDFGALQRVAWLADELAGVVRTPPVLVEIQGPLGPSLDRHLAAAAEQAGEAVLAVSLDEPRRIRRTVRQAAGRAGAHLALVPELDPSIRLVRR